MPFYVAARSSVQMTGTGANPSVRMLPKTNSILIEWIGHKCLHDELIELRQAEELYKALGKCLDAFNAKAAERTTPLSTETDDRNAAEVARMTGG